MRGKKKKSIEEYKKELEELIAKSDQSKQDILVDYKDYRAIRKQIDNSGSLHDDDDIQWMNKLYDAFLLGKLIPKKQSMIQDARKVASAAAVAPAGNLTLNTSMSNRVKQGEQNHGQLRVNHTNIIRSFVYFLFTVFALLQ
jgi:hypothetical protein